MTNAKKPNHVYDYAIIGSGLSGLAIANSICKFTSNIVLIESSDSFGGMNRSLATPLGPTNNGLRFLPNTELSKKALSFLESIIEQSLEISAVESQPVTFENGGLKPFLGFGQNPPEFYEELGYFTPIQSLKTNLAPHEWTQILYSNFRGDFLPRSYVTKLIQAEDRISHLIVNGQKTISALNFIYCGPIKQLKTLLPEGVLSNRSLQKLSKETFWTAVGMDLLHSNKITEEDNIHVLNGTTQDEIGPCVGQFQTFGEVNGQMQQYSQWLTFIEDDEAEDSERVGIALKKIKRQIKRAYPNALDNLLFERILVVPSQSGSGGLKLQANQTLGGLENLWIGSGQVNNQKNLIGTLLQAELVAASIGFSTGVQTETQSFAQI